MNYPKSYKEKDILSQIKVEYQMAYDYVNPRRIQNLDRLRLYSNQRRDKELVGDTIFFSIFQTVFSQLYDDRLSVNFTPGHQDDTHKVAALRPVAKYDAYKMKKEQIDYDWDWYTCFWGAGFLDVTTYDPKKKLMLPSVIDNATFLLDPDCTLINGDARGQGKARFWGREISLTKYDMKDAGTYENYDTLHAGTDISSLSYMDKSYRRNAQNLANPAQPVAYDNENIPLLEWWTCFDGEKWMVTTDIHFTRIVRTMKWKYEDWGVIHRKLFPIPGDPFGVSVPDLVEDKQRARSILTNLGLMHAKSDLYPMHLYDRNVVSPTTDLSFGFNKWIPVDGNPAESVKMLDKQPIGQIVSYIMDVIDQSAQKATAATSMQQGVQSEKPRSANEVVRTFNAGEERISTSAKVFGWSEREFWSWWLKLYGTYFTLATTKRVRIEGAFGQKFKVFKGDDFQFEEDPDIYIESRNASDQENNERIQQITAFVNLTAQDQSLNRRYLNKKAASIVGGFDQEEVDRLYPATPDEIQAEDENERLDVNKLVKIDINDDHATHLLVHANASPTKATIVHIAAHRKAILMQRAMQRDQEAAQQNGAVPSGSQPLSTQNQPNLPGTGSAPAASTPSGPSVQQ